jgi:hypothetical protein
MEDRTSGRFGSHKFSRIRRVWLAGCSGPPRSAGNRPGLHRNHTASPVFSSGHRSCATWVDGSRPLFPLRLSYARSLSLFLFSSLCLSLSASLSLPQPLAHSLFLPLRLSACSGSIEKKEEERKNNEEGRRKKTKKKREKRRKL